MAPPVKQAPVVVTADTEDYSVSSSTEVTNSDIPELPSLNRTIENIKNAVLPKKDNAYDNLTEHGFPRSALFRGNKILEMARSDEAGLTVPELFAAADKLVKRNAEKAGVIYFDIATSDSFTNAHWGARPGLNPTPLERAKAYSKLVKNDCPQKNRANIDFRYGCIFTSVDEVLVANTYLDSQGIDTTTNNLVEDALDSLIYASDDLATARGISLYDRMDAVQHLQSMGQKRNNDAKYVADKLRTAYLATNDTNDKYDLLGAFLELNPYIEDYTSIFDDELSMSDTYYAKIIKSDNLIHNMSSIRLIEYAMKDAGKDPGNFVEEASFALAHNQDISLNYRTEAALYLEDIGSNMGMGSVLTVYFEVQDELKAIRANPDYYLEGEKEQLLELAESLAPGLRAEMFARVTAKSALLTAILEESLNPDSIFSWADPAYAKLRAALDLEPEIDFATIQQQKNLEEPSPNS
jgi:hypothetical protein